MKVRLQCSKNRTELSSADNWELLTVLWVSNGAWGRTFWADVLPFCSCNDNDQDYS